MLKVLLSAVKCGLAVGTGPEAERRLARRVREAFTELGPSYIKLGEDIKRITYSKTYQFTFNLS